MRGLKATLVACVAGASLYAQSASRSAGWDTLQRWFRGPALLAAHPDQHEERFEAEARLAVRRGEPPECR